MEINVSDVDITYTTGTRAEREATTPEASMLWYESDYGQWAFWDTASAAWILLPITSPAATTIGELTAVTAANDDDVLLLSQGGSAKKITAANFRAPLVQGADIVTGTRAEREAATPDGPTLWYETDQEAWWYWAAASETWCQLGITFADVQPSGIIEGLQISRAGADLIQIEPGAIQIRGQRYYLSDAVQLVGGAVTTFGWRAMKLIIPTGDSRQLSSRDFGSSALNIAKGESGIWWHTSQDWLIIGIFPYVNDDVLDFYTAGGKYIFSREFVNDASPPTTATRINIGLPNLGEPMVGHYLAEAEGAATSIITLNVHSVPVLGLAADDGSVGARSVQGPVMISSSHGTANLHLDVDSGGTASQLTLTLQAVDIPSGMAR
jgi:hypothetical protein